MKFNEQVINLLFSAVITNYDNDNEIYIIR